LNADVAGTVSNPRGNDLEFREGAGMRFFSSPVVAGILWVLAILIIIPNVSTLKARANRWDFSHYYLSALVMRTGGNPYRTDLTSLGRRYNLEVKSIDHAGYPPTFVLCFEPLTLLRPTPAYWVWVSITVLALAGALWILISEAGLSFEVTRFALPAGLLYYPLWNHFKFAQCQIMILLLLLVMMRALRTGKDWVAGTALATAILLRIFPATMAGYLLVRREWRALAYTAIVTAVGGAMTLLATGFRTGLSFFGVIGFVTGPEWMSSETNVALGAAISRLFGYMFGNNPTPIVDISRSFFYAGGLATVLAMSVAGSWVPQSRQPDRDWRAASLWVVATILVAPTAWMHYLVLLYIPLAMVLGSAERGSARSAETRMALVSYLGGSYIVIGFLTALAQAAPRLHATVLVVEREGFFFFVLLLFFAMYKFAMASPHSEDCFSVKNISVAGRCGLDDNPPRVLRKTWP